ncbi:hypothetical protein BC332_20742 [Capsicum chinense]|nr:hypothetical protein BC332_20742 [Capsicum chinense]
MYEMLNGKDSHVGFDQNDINDLCYVINENLKQGSRDPPLSYEGSPVLVVPLIGPSTIPSGINFERPRAPSLVSNVTLITMIPPETLSPVPLAYPAQVPQPQMNSSMNNSLPDASMTMNNNQSYSSGFSMSPILSEMLDWNDDIITLLDDPYFNGINFQDPSHNNNNFLGSIFCVCFF